jgi:hypothetical protein
MSLLNSGGRFRVNVSGGIGCLIVGVLGLVVAFYVLKGLFNILWLAAPFLFAAALIINWRSVANTGKWLFQVLQRDPLRGLILAVLGVVAFPILALFLFLQALGSRRIEQFRNQYGAPPSSSRQVQDKGDFIDFEELESRPKPQPRRSWPEFGREEEQEK